MTSRPVEYAALPPLSRRRWFVRAVLLGVVLIVLAVSPLWFPPAYQRAQILFWQRQCLSFGNDPDTIAPGAAQTTPHPLPWLRLAALLGIAPDPTKPLLVMGAIGEVDDPVLLVVTHHGRARDGGAKPTWTLRVRLLRRGNAWQAPWMMSDQIINIGSPPIDQVHRDDTHQSPDASIPWGAMHRGRIESTDPAHFTLTTDFAGQRHTVDGWVRSVGTPKASVTLEWRQPPLPTTSQTLQ